MSQKEYCIDLPLFCFKMYETTNVLVILLVSLVIYMYVAYLVNLYGLPSHWFLYVGSTENKSENNP